MEIKHVFLIATPETPAKSWKRDASTFALFVSLIGLGWILGSSAMEWAGLIVAFIVTIVRAGGVFEKYSTADEAIARIKEIASQE